MTTYYPRQSSSFGAVLLTLIVAAILIVGVLWFIGHNSREDRDSDLFPTTTSRTSASVNSGITSASAGLRDAGTSASSALSKAGAAASTAVSEASADIKAAVNKQKQQEAAESHAS